jgi:hypothetical protein
VDGRKAVGEGDVDGEHDGADGDAIGGDDDMVVALHEALVEEDPEKGDEEGENDEEVAGEGWTAGGVMVRSAQSDESCSGGGEGESGPAQLVEAFVGKDGCAYGEDYGHRSNHERGVRDGGEREAFELEDELERNAKEGGEEEHAPFGCVEAGAMRDEQGQKADEGEGEAVEDHRADVHFVEGNFAEVEAASPEATGEEGGGEAEGAMLF